MRKSAKLSLALLVLAAGGLIAFAGAKPEAYRSVADVASDPSGFEGRAVDVKATVAAGSVNRSGDALTFRIADDRAEMPVVWASDRPVPEHEAGGSIEGRSIVVTGTVERGADGAWVFRATDMQVGCASKYEPAAPAP